MEEHIHLDIGGMSCIHCQTKIEDALNATKGVIKASVSYKKASADIEYDASRINTKKLIGVIENLDYKVLSTREKSSPDIINSLCLLMTILALFYVLQKSGLLNLLVPGSLAESGMSFGMLFAIGMITSVHCIAMCGGISLSQSIPKQKSHIKMPEPGQKALLPPLFYNLGRVCSYTLTGFILGSIGMFLGGSGTGVSLFFQGIIKILAGIWLTIMGINLLGIFPWFRALSLHTPLGFSKIAGLGAGKKRGPFIIGLLNGLMPCGPLQSMWIVALASGNPFTGAVSMLMFSLGTVPLMLGFGSIVSLMCRKYTNQVMKAGAILIAVMGLSMLTQGVVLSGLLSTVDQVVYAETVDGSLDNTSSKSGLSSNPESVTKDQIQVVDGVQIVNSTLTRGRYPEITVKAGIPVRWTIDAPEGSLNGCNYRMFIQHYGIEHTFDYGENVIEFTPTETGVVPYSCWMGMIYGKINVIDTAGEAVATGDSDTSSNNSVINVYNASAFLNQEGYTDDSLNRSNSPDESLTSLPSCCDVGGTDYLNDLPSCCDY